MFKSLGSIKKLLPTIVLLILAALAGGTDVFSAAVHDVVSKLLADYAEKVMPFAVNLLIGAIVLNVAYLLYHPMKEGLNRALQNSGASQRGKDFAVKALQLVYWGVALLLVATIVAPEVLAKFFLGVSLLSAALVWAMQGAANDFICGVLLHFTPKFSIGDTINLEGLTVNGEVKDIGYLSTRIIGKDGMYVVPNREVWQRAVKVGKPTPPPSLIILP